MVAASRIVCAIAALCGATRAAPSVSYDQRQNGEFNLQVGVDDVAIVLLPGGAGDLFDRKRYALTGEKLLQIFGRRNGSVLRKKKKKPEQNCTTNNETPIAAQPEKPHNGSSFASLPESPAPYAPASPASPSAASPASPPAAYPASSSPLQPPVPGNNTFPEPAPISEHSDAAPEDLDVRLAAARPYIRPGASVHDPYSVTPSTPDIFPRPQVTEDDCDDGYYDDGGDATAAADSAADTTAATVEKSPGATAEKSPGATAERAGTQAAVAGDVVAAAVAETEPATDFVEKPATASPDAKTVDNSGSVGGPVVNKAQHSDGVAPTTHANPAADAKPQTAGDRPAAVAVKTVPQPESPVKTSSADGKKPTNEQRVAVEMVAMKTMEKPTFSEALKVHAKKQPPSAAEKPVTETAATKTADKPKPSPDASEPAKKPQSDSAASGWSGDKSAEMVAMKTIEKPATPSAAAADKSGIARPAEVQPHGDAAAAGGGDEPGDADSAKSGARPAEMIAVKTVESPGAVSTAKGVVPVKTATRPGVPPKTASALPSNGTSFMRRVGDRKPLPTVTLDVSHPKVVE